MVQTDQPFGDQKVPLETLKINSSENRKVTKSLAAILNFTLVISVELIHSSTTDSLKVFVYLQLPTAAALVLARNPKYHGAKTVAARLENDWIQVKGETSSVRSKTGNPALTMGPV